MLYILDRIGHSIPSVTDDDLSYASIAETAPRVVRRDVSPVELTRACLERIATFDGRGGLNAFITVLADEALAQAEHTEREIAGGSYRGPLHGIPIAHKDLYYTRGVRTTAGSQVLGDFVPDEDATVVASLKQAGTILLGKLNMHEFAAGGTNDNPHYGACRNPWDLERIPGGSSGGSGAALAAGMCFGATGSDTAGSIRMPSHCCGTSGIKPTYGRVSCFGVVPLSWSLDHPGPMARGIEDCALLLNAIAGFDRRDFASVDRPAEDFTRDLHLGVRGLRVGVPRTYFTELVQPDVERAWRAAVETLAQLGAEPVEVDFTQLGIALETGMAIVRAEMAVYHRPWYEQRLEAYGPGLRERFATGQQMPAATYIGAQRARERVRADLYAALDVADVIATPTLPVTATRIGSDQVQIGERSVNIGDQLTRFTYPFNLSGFPAVSVPCGFDRDGLPIGLQLAAGPWQEALLVRVGHAYQQATDWHRRRPPLGASTVASQSIT
jgi:aspartyl-tRNA(Asn)/glutamyl-tRNA(Gln) amidotransferase subunit A